ncbi:hypothetical protein MBLNU459_g4558t1 [Dothideomycetes sp. NU459]
MGSSTHVHIKASSSLDKYPAKQHAARVALGLDVDQGLIYLSGASIVNFEDSDMPRPFRQLRYFSYLSGVDEAECHLTYDIGKDHLTLWLPPIDPRRAVWVGRGSTTEEAVEKYDVDEARYSSSLDHFLQTWVRTQEGQVYVLHSDEKVPESVTARLNTNDLQPATDACRVVKDSHEISLIKKANLISAAAHTAVLSNLLTFTNETEVEAKYLDICVAHGAKHQAYEIIAGSGSNAAILHYVKNDEDFGDSQLMCLDAGAEWQSYASDVTRTFPLSGRWPTEEAKQIYDLVQLMQTKCMNALGPGKRFVDAHYLAHQVAIEGLLKLGILHNGSIMEIYKAGTSVAFFPHGLGHHMGLEVHDVSPTARSKNAQGRSAFESWMEPCTSDSPVLCPGMVITVEPGIYFNKYALDSIYLPSPVHSKYINKAVLERFMPVGGVRIEDDILITSHGYDNLTTTPKGEEALRIIRGEIDVMGLAHHKQH